MVIIKLQGGLGNQMFQYSLGKKLQLTQGKKVFYDLSYFVLKTNRPFELDLFGIKLDKINGLDVLRLPSTNNRMLNKISALYQIFFPVETISQKTFAFDERFLNAPDSAYLEGYWQTEQYFSDIRKELINDFKFSIFESCIKSDLHALVTDTDSVSIHIRMGDYGTYANNVFMICDWQYYLTAIDLISSKLNNPHFIIFSDEPQWCLENIKIDQPFTVVTKELSGSSFNDLYLMSCCKHNIIANSSFSWWAAWLNQNEKKIVLAPHRWFADKNINTKDIIPDSWLRI